MDDDIQLALIVRPKSGFDSLILYASGDRIEYEVQALGDMVTDVFPSLEGFPDHGIWVWEGKIECQLCDHHFECDPAFTTIQWRLPTAEEWLKLMVNESPWPSRYNTEVKPNGTNTAG